MQIEQKQIPHKFRNKHLVNVGSYTSGGNSTNQVNNTKFSIYDGLDSTNAEAALSANMGKWLQDNKADKTGLHTHANLTYLDLIDQNLSKISSPLFNGMNITTAISSPDFLSGLTGTGWKIGLTDNKSYSEFDSLLVRGVFTASEFLLNQVRATNGNLAVSDSAKIESVTDNVITISGEDNNMMVFQTGDVLKCQKFTGTSIKMYKLQVESITGLTFQFSILEGTAGLIKEGDTLVRWTSTTNDSRKGLVYLTSSDSYAPFIDTTYDGVTKARFGNLEGIIADGSALSGYGIYCDNGYFKGNVVITGGNAATKDYVLNNTAKHCGDWKADTAYIKSSMVTYNNCTWMAMNDVPANYKPDTEYTLTSIGRYLYSGDAQLAINTKNWELISERDYSKILGYTDYTDMLAKAEAGQTIISGGYINTNLINTSALIVNGGLATASDVTTALSPYLKSETIIEGGYIKTGLINVDTLFSNKSVSVSGVFTGSVATPFKQLPEDAIVWDTEYTVGHIDLDFTTGFNFSFQASVGKTITLVLPSGSEYDGVQSDILNYMITKMGDYLYIQGSFLIKNKGLSAGINKVVLSSNCLLQLKSINGGWYVLNSNDFTLSGTTLSSN